MGKAITQIGDQELQALVSESGIPIVVDFWAPWCDPCRAVAAILDEIAVSHVGYIHVVGVDVDGYAEAAARLGVQGLPTVIVFVNGQEVARLSGSVSRSALLGAISAAMDES